MSDERNNGLPDSQSIDELIRSTREEIARSDAKMHGEKKEETFQPELPPEYASLSLESERKKKSESGKRTFIYVASVLLISMILAVFAWSAIDDICALTSEDRTVTVTIEEGDSIAKIADTLHDAGLVRYKLLFRLYCSASHAGRSIIPGTYELNTIFDYHALVNGMASSGRRATASVMIPEGYTCAEIFALLEEKGVCNAEDLYNAAANGDFDYAFLAGTEKGDRNRLEGCLFPDTYEFYLSDDAENVLQKLLKTMDSKLTEEHWAALDALNAQLRTKKASAGFGSQEIAEGDLTMHDILIVASLIEKEAANAGESATIASVIYNRLCSKAYPYLNIDATIQYALDERKDVLTDADKLIDSPYNTYKYPGLPVGPIACPGMASIRGALYPEDTDYYFYALGNDGTHTFTRTYEEHLAFLGTLDD
ncbi:MAG: endolytic transglycosylase MltG [Oscillospiraceae bacterium]|nr:endolytic transglycosylase MltG [Oscillospiraceae bacterium]